MNLIRNKSLVGEEASDKKRNWISWPHHLKSGDSAGKEREQHSQKIPSFCEDLKPTELIPGMVLNARYQILEMLGNGGMGVVYLVEDLSCHRKRALKLLNASPEDQEQGSKRFQREVDAIRKLQHPHLVKLYDSGTIGGVMFYTMTALPGGDLAHRLRKEEVMSIPDALRMVSKIASALQSIHDQHLLHRDIKPDNILFTEDNEPILTDFGLVIDLDQNCERLTKKGCVVGTAHYLSPEQILRPGEVDHRVDIYALGVILYELVLGFNPYLSKCEAEVIASILLHGYPPLSDYLVHPPLEAICSKALHKDPNQRFATAGDMQQAIEQLLDDLSTGT